MNNKEYQQNELNRFLRDREAMNNQPKRDRAAARQEIQTAVADGSFLRTVEDTAAHIMQGNYGVGVLIHFNMMTRRMNRAAWLFSMSASEAYTATYDDSRKSWNKLTETDQKVINAKLKLIIEEYDKEPHIVNVI